VHAAAPPYAAPLAPSRRPHFSNAPMNACSCRP
jgi:hypothetical protein